ncbi:hypothetical protein NGR_b08820 (plasmid) [Sinorhizobium fredii NGR234]|uniref:Uncharacterized protein n=1 Tax=Sinorhizobium fredii (strain NBRC 101917 / NGR234) TaxID=394 RepID=C3KQI0_SINFN|nr:hypothetical protein NGR_b08820 [Sinorhizobium fredii NGR234]
MRIHVTDTAKSLHGGAAPLILTYLPAFPELAGQPGERDLQRRAPYQARKGRCGTLNCCMSLSLNRRRFKETGSQAWKNL